MRDDKEFQQLTLDSFRRLPVDIRTRCIESVLNIYQTQQGEQDEITKLIVDNPYTWWATHHHGWGMSMRNFLRDYYTDEKLPPTPYGDEAYSNWDDYVYGVVEVAFKEGIYHLLNDSERI